MTVYTYQYPHPAVTADCIVFARHAEDTKVLLIKRKNAPCKGFWAFPGGFMNIDETAEETAKRELEEETGLKVNEIYQVGAFSKVDRDPRERVVTIAYYTILEHAAQVQGRDDAGDAQWFGINDLPPLAFDHAEILQRAIALLHDARPSMPDA